MRLFLSTEEMGIDVMTSGQRLLLLAVIVYEIKLIWFVIYWVALCYFASLTVTLDSPSLTVFNL